MKWIHKPIGSSSTAFPLTARAGPAPALPASSSGKARRGAPGGRKVHVATATQQTTASLRSSGIPRGLPSGEHTQNGWEIHHFEWANQLFQ